MLANFLRRPRPGHGGRQLGDVQPGARFERSGYTIVECLRVKGYCVMPDMLPPVDLREAQNAIPEVKSWTQPAILIQDGLLGEEGSSQIARVPMADPSETPGEGSGLAGMDYVIGKLMEDIARYQEDLGFRCTSRSMTILHEANYPEYTDTDLADQEADEWCSIFMTHKIMVLVFLGPGKGSLELQLFDEDADPIEIVTDPGQIVVVRTDQLFCRFYNKGSDPTYAASSFLMQSDILRMHRNKMEEHMVPAAKELDSFIAGRLQEIKEQEPEDFTDWEEHDAPLSWVRAANRMYFKQQMINARGVCVRMAHSWEAEVSYGALLINGMDAAKEVPFSRWDHSHMYDVDADKRDGGELKTACKHGGFCDGLDLFDLRTFNLTAVEVRDMDPGQRNVLECTYEALYKSGYKKSGTMNLACGMFVGHGQSEWGSVDRSSSGAHGATGGAASIAAGRLSFSLGCKGASVAIDTDQAASLTAAWSACESIQKKGYTQALDVSCAIGVHLNLAQVEWLSRSAAGWLSSTGRCLTFDASADGWIAADGVGCAVLAVRKDDKADADIANVGTIVGGATNNSGRGSSLVAIHGPSVQELLMDAITSTSIMPTDVDIMEIHGRARLTDDFIEVMACGTALRNWEQGKEGVLCYTNSKSNFGNSIETAGLSSLLKTMFSIKWGVVMANQHMRELNRRLDPLDSRCANFSWGSEMIEQTVGMGSVFAGCIACGFGGTNVYMQCWGGADELLHPPPEPTPEELRPRITYWPGGGGDLGRESRPHAGYYIRGTFNNWGSEQPMQFEGEGWHGYTIVLSENGWEMFNFLLDGQPTKVLHPGMYKAPTGTQVLGPDDITDPRESTWLLDARAEPLDDVPEGMKSIAGKDDAQTTALSLRGTAGDCYRIRLHVAGKWRTVTWAKTTKEAADPKALALVHKPPAAFYRVHWSWGSNAATVMERDEKEPGHFTLEAELNDSNAYFVILRNGDWCQAILPAEPNAPSGTAAYGPDDYIDGYSWRIRGRAGQRYKITFARVWEENREVMRVDWDKL